MQDVIFEVAKKYNKYPVNAYGLVFEALHEAIEYHGEGHVTGEQVALSFLAVCIKGFGWLASTVCQELNMLRSEDVGAIVFQLVEEKLIGKQESDSEKDFAKIWNLRDLEGIVMVVKGEKGNLTIDYTLPGDKPCI